MVECLGDAVNFPPLWVPFTYGELESMSTLELLHLNNWNDQQIHKWNQEDPEANAACRSMLLKRYEALMPEGSLQQSTTSEENLPESSSEGMSENTGEETMLANESPNILSSPGVELGRAKDVSSPENALEEILPEDSAMEDVLIEDQEHDAESIGHTGCEKLLKQVHERVYGGVSSIRKRVPEGGYEGSRQREDERRRKREEKVKNGVNADDRWSGERN